MNSVFTPKNACFTDSEKMFSVLENSSNFAYFLDRQKRIVMICGALPSYVTCDAQDLLGLSCQNIFSADTNALHEIAHQGVFNGKSISYRWFAKEKSGRVSYYQTSLTPVFHKDGFVSGVFALAGKTAAVGFAGYGETAVSEHRGQSFSQVLMSMREQEKKKVSVVLHDELGSLAVALSSILGILEEDIKEGKSEDAVKGIKKLKTYTESFIDRVKKLAVDLRPPNIDTAGITGVVRDLIILVSQYSKTKIDFSDKVKDENIIGENVRITLYRVVQETINNILKHSCAKNAKVELATDRNSVRLTISDDGQGFDYGTATLSMTKCGKIGILGMKESVEYIGGTFKIKTAKGRGTVISVKCPLASYMGRI